MDYWGNISFGARLNADFDRHNLRINTLRYIANGLGQPLGSRFTSQGAALLFAFPFIEKRVEQPLFNLDLFKNREFATANIATFLSSISRGGVMVMLVVLLQGIWLPLHGYSYDSTPFWAGIFMLPMSIGIALTGPLSGWLSDKHGARVLATTGMIITGVAFLSFHSVACKL